ncbi:hypothetical protein F5050DRAFT_1712779 [Lentinula boryana]|uniref:F-box domain-containing protein n=1 Tax=Lentinula boryana TaxID=40481 RepID=A0ABQ8QAY1_9AGAR|nr:hypothetical protein F5050DRAFT_1712779 [Lentinula boryana]
MPDFPQELIDRFVDESSDSTEHLKNLSLVGWPWLYRARYYLFSCITLAPQDPKEIKEYYNYLKRKASSTHPSSRYFYPLSPKDRQFLHSSLAQNPQAQKLLLSSVTPSLPYVRSLRLESSIRIGGGRKVTAEEYFHRWLGFGSDTHAVDSILMRDLSRYEDFSVKQKERWDAVDLPWGHQAGIHALPFRNLCFIHIQWSVLGWIPPFDDYHMGAGDESAVSPGYQLDTLDHVSIDEYPGYRLEQYNSTRNAEALLDIIIQNAPKIKSLCLGGLMLPCTSSSSELDINVMFPNHAPLLVRNRPVYPSGEEVPNVSSDDYDLITAKYSHPSSADARRANNLSLERLFLRGFDEESLLLIEDALLNAGASSTRNTKYLALSAMPDNFDYMFLLSKSRRSLTHLTLDIDESTLHLKLRFPDLPCLECIQLISHSALYSSSLEHIIWSLYQSAMAIQSGRDTRPIGSQPLPIRTVKLLHLGFHRAIKQDPHLRRRYSEWSEIDAYLLEMVQTTPFELMTVKIKSVTVNLAEDDIADALPMSFETGCLRSGETNEWWTRHAYL